MEGLLAVVRLRDVRWVGMQLDSAAVSTRCAMLSSWSSPPVAPAGSDNPSIDSATMPTVNRSLIRMRMRYRSRQVTCTDADDRPLRCMGTINPMIQNQNTPWWPG